MQDYIYSVIAFVAMVIHLIINYKHNPDQTVVSVRGSREYRMYLHAVFVYYILDASWGVFAGILLKPISYNKLAAVLSATR